MLDPDKISDLLTQVRYTPRELFVSSYVYPFLCALGAQEDGETDPEAETFDVRALDQRPVVNTERGTWFAVLPFSHFVGSDASYDEAEVTVGRAWENSIRVSHRLLSKRHASFLLKPDGSVWLSDLGSRNGTSVNDDRLSAGEPRRLQPGDTITLGGATFYVADAGEAFDHLRQVAADSR